jgi:hypothetical protein
MSHHGNWSDPLSGATVLLTTPHPLPVQGYDLSIG